MDLIEGLAQATPPLRVTDTRRLAELRQTVETAERKSELRRVEDPVDAVICAYVGAVRDPATRGRDHLRRRGHRRHPHTDAAARSASRPTGADTRRGP